MRSRADGIGWAALTLLLSSCGGGQVRPSSAGGHGHRWIASDVPVKIGKPYQAAGRWWVPAEQPGYDEVGLATWYGADHQGATTSSGERFDRTRISAAHTSLPLPSYVEVTALDTGRTILVRINDRGPFKAGRIIDLSQGAARQLGVEGQGIARVRVRHVDPPESERALLRAGMPAGYRATLSATERDAQARRLGVMAPVTTTLPATIRGDYFVQIATLSNEAHAYELAGLFADLGRTDIIAERALWRVRAGPFATLADATAALAQVRARGYQDANIAQRSTSN